VFFFVWVGVCCSLFGGVKRAQVGGLWLRGGGQQRGRVVFGVVGGRPGELAREEKKKGGRGGQLGASLFGFDGVGGGGGGPARCFFGVFGCCVCCVLSFGGGNRGGRVLGGVGG